LTQQVTFLHTADLEKTTTFYRDILGLPLVLDQGVCRIFGVNNAAFLGFCQHFDAKTAGDTVILTLVSPDVAGWQTFLEEQGVEIEKPTTFYEKFNITHIFFRDPNGYLVEIQTFHDPAWPAVDAG
jgi:catechol 2,3-dioxygenase-like lactoylglutathione lyase family enzyme